MAALRTASKYRHLIDRLPTFRIVSPALNEELWRRAGFPGSPAEGVSIIPSVVGRSTEFNARGKEIVRKDLPMEPRSQMISTSWEDWHGQTHHGTQYRTYMAYPREHVLPPEEYITSVPRDGELVATSREIQNDESEDVIANILNVFLEIFAQLEITQPNFAASIQVRTVNWKILPPGEYPYERAATALAEYVQRLAPDRRDIAQYRIRAITRHRPNFIALGVGGFSDYVVFGFTHKKRFVLESPYIGNATYVFRDEWESVSGLSKAEIIEGDLHEARLIHTASWPRQLRKVIESP